MGGLFDSPEPVRAPPVPKTPPVPTVDEDKVKTQAKKKRPSGRLDTFLTGDLVPETNKKKVLG